MAMQVHSKNRLCIGLASLAVVAVLLVVYHFWDPSPDHPIVESTDFYSESLLGEPVANQDTGKRQVSRHVAMSTLLLHNGDLLADYSFLPIRNIVTNEQLFEAKMLTRKYDLRLKEIRRERAAILEQAGVSIIDPKPALNQIHVKAFDLYIEAHKEILKEVCDEKQRKLIDETSRRNRAARREAARRAVESGKDNQ